MPLDQVISVFMRDNNCLNVVLVKSLDLFKPGKITRDMENEDIVISPRGILWTEKNVKHRILMEKYFWLATKFGKEQYRDPVYTQAGKFADCICFNLKLCKINLELLMRQTIKVSINDLRINLVANKPFSLHCSNCAKELSGMRAYRLVAPLPGYAMEVTRDFWDNLEVTKIAFSDQIYYGLNQIVMSANNIEVKTEMTYCRRRRRVLCPGCPRVLGTCVSSAVCLHADALRMGTRASSADPLDFNELHGHITPTQLMLRLMKNCDRSRLFLKTTRPDGQIHYLFLMTELNKKQFLRSKLSLPSKTDRKPGGFLGDGDTSSEGEDNMDTSSDSDRMEKDTSTDEDLLKTLDIPDSTPRPPRKLFKMRNGRKPSRIAPIPTNITNKPINYVYLTSYEGYRVKYIFATNDSELRDIQDTIDEWRSKYVPTLRISYSMMIELVSELNANEHIEAALQNLIPADHFPQPRFSHIILESDEEFYAKQQRLDEVAELQPTPDDNSAGNEIIESKKKAVAISISDSE